MKPVRYLRQWWDSRFGASEKKEFWDDIDKGGNVYGLKDVLDDWFNALKKYFALIKRFIFR